MTNNNIEMPIEEIIRLAISFAKRQDIPVSQAYDISRELWKLYWRYKK